MKDMMKIIMGNICITLAYGWITVPNEMINGGVTSFSLILEGITGLSIQWFINGITIMLLLSCLLFLGKAYFLKSIFSSVCNMVFFNLFYTHQIRLHIPIMIELVIAATLVAIGYYLCISAKSSVASFDIIALILHKKNNKIHITNVMRVINIGVILMGFLSYGVWSIILGIVFTLIQLSILKRLLRRNEKRVNQLIKI